MLTVYWPSAKRSSARNRIIAEPLARRRGGALGPGHGEDAQLAALRERQYQTDIGEHDVDLAAPQIDQGRRQPLIGDMGHVDAGHALEQLGRELRRAETAADP